MYKADKIILHSIWSRKIIYFNLGYLKNVMWGADFNSKVSKYDIFKKIVIRNMGNIYKRRL